MDGFPSADNRSVALINQISGHNGTGIRNFNKGHHRLISSERTEDGGRRRMTGQYISHSISSSRTRLAWSVTNARLDNHFESHRMMNDASDHRSLRPSSLHPPLTEIRLQDNQPLQPIHDAMTTDGEMKASISRDRSIDLYRCNYRTASIGSDIIRSESLRSAACHFDG